MPRPANIKKDILSVVTKPGRLYTTWGRLRAQSNVRMSELVGALNDNQRVFDSVKPFLPTSDARYTVEKWDEVALAQWDAIPNGGVVAQIGVVQAAGQALTMAYATAVLPAVQPKQFTVDVTTGLIVTDYILSTAEWALMHTATDDFLAALEPVSEL